MARCRARVCICCLQYRICFAGIYVFRVMKCRNVFAKEEVQNSCGRTGWLKSDLELMYKSFATLTQDDVDSNTQNFTSPYHVSLVHFHVLYPQRVSLMVDANHILTSRLSSGVARGLNTEPWH
ncbi:hypothetical protein POJ06DRAFT_260996 [Lipomyces tetrasporus]|uniref:Uncharacterized protein n=1 Tax=Lipomyces tetrasporus TaxID=54092 RepID=A0AAD7QLB7_9ASCO|nr:uncharacterized protein POJ06DRAFT_260996 [Lipomyces tetrasporus]KAJ8097288.1 hypothetical protein POJ06DRAFT_260996 [Lipomyces tetrasporus]